MPILQVDALPQVDSSKISDALKKTCNAIATAYGCQPEQVWGIWNEIRPRFYVEGSKEAETQPKKTHPPVGRLICFEGKDPETIERVLQTAASTLAESLGIPGNIFIMYDEAQSGKVIAGDGVVKRNL